MFLRIAKIADLTQISLIENDAGFHPRSEQQLKKSIQTHRVWVIAANDNDVAGFAIFQQLLDEVELLNIVIAKNEQGKGLGRQLLDEALSLLRAEKSSKCLLEVGHKNHGAIKLYSSMGFEKVGVRKNYYTLPSGSQDALLFVKLLQQEIDHE